MQHGACKHMTSFKIKLMDHPVPAKYDITALSSHKKRGRPRKSSSRWTIDAPQNIIVIDKPDNHVHVVEGFHTSGVEM